MFRDLGSGLGSTQKRFQGLHGLGFRFQGFCGSLLGDLLQRKLPENAQFEPLTPQSPKNKGKGSLSLELVWLRGGM